MRKLSWLVLLMSFSLFSQEIEYKEAEKLLKNNEFEAATSNIQSAIKKAKSNKSRYYLLYANILKSKNVADSSLYYYNLIEDDYSKRQVTDSLLLTIALKVEFYRYFNEKKSAEIYTKKLDQFQLSDIQNKDIVGFALNRKMAVLNTYHNKNKDTIQLIGQVGKQIIDLESKITKKDIVAYTMNELAQFEDYVGDKSKAIKMYQNAKEFAQKNDLVNPEIDGSFNHARYYAHNFEDYKNAIAVLESIEDKVLNSSNLFHKYNLYFHLKQFYFANKDFRKAYLASEDCHKYSLDIKWNESMVKLNEIERKYDIAKKQKEIQDKEIEITIQNLEIENSAKRFWLVFVIFIITALASLALVYFFNRERKSNKEHQFLSNQNEFLLSEANHRINNNLQLVIILITTQIKKLPDHESQEVRKILKKINSIATLHRHLYQSNDKRHVNIYEYLKDIEHSFSELFSENKIASNFEIDAIELSADVSMYLGLLLTELCINSIKYAFENQDDKQIAFKLKKQNQSFLFYFADNGMGLPSENTIPVLMAKLCRQLKVQYKIENTNGFSFSFEKEIN